MEVRLMKPDGRAEREARDLAVYSDYQELMTVEGQSKTKVHEYLMQKYNVHSQSTIYLILKRVEERKRKEGAA